MTITAKRQGLTMKVLSFDTTDFMEAFELAEKALGITCWPRVETVNGKRTIVGQLEYELVARS